MKNLQKTMQVVILLILTGTLLVSCGKQDTPPVTTGTSGVLVATGTIQVPVPATRRNNRSVKSVASSGASVSAAQEKMLERVKNIATLDDLVALNSSILDNPKKDHPRFVELQKKQMMLGMMQSQILSSEYKDIQKNLASMYEAKELWTPEILALDVKIQEVMKSFSTNTWSQSGIGDELKKLMIQKNTLMQKVRTSTEFQEYMQKNYSKIKSLNQESEKYWTPEMVRLQEEITTLSKEVYGTPPTK